MYKRGVGIDINVLSALQNTTRFMTATELRCSRTRFHCARNLHAKNKKTLNKTLID